MKKRRKLIVAGCLLGVLAVCYFGYGWQLEWNTNSGYKRTVHSMLGVSVYTGKPEPTVISEWRNIDSGDGKWIRIASGPNRGMSVNPCYVHVLNNLRQTELMIRDPMLRREYSGWILEDLRENQRICDLSRHCDSVTDAMMRLELAMISSDIDYEDASLSIEQLKRIWNEPENAQPQR